MKKHSVCAIVAKLERCQSGRIDEDMPRPQLRKLGDCLRLLRKKGEVPEWSNGAPC